MRNTVFTMMNSKYLKLQTTIEGTKEFLKSIMELQTVKPHVLAQPNKAWISRDCNCSRDLSAS